MIPISRVLFATRGVLPLLLISISALVGFTKGNNVRGVTNIKLLEPLKESGQLIPTVSFGPDAGVEIFFDDEQHEKRVRSRSRHGGHEFSTDSPAAEGRITGGTVVSPNKFSFFALLIGVHKGRYYPRCGATHIEEEWILTAAHCKVKKGDIAWIGAYNAASKRDQVTIEECFKHPKYAFPEGEAPIYDFQLCKLKRPSTMATVRVTEERRFLDDKTLTVIGMGAEKYGGDFTTKLSQAPVDYQPKSDCNNIYTPYFMFDNMLCAGGGTTDSCKGDSGGPLLDYDDSTGYTQVGVVSFGIKGCGEGGYPGVYADLRTQIQWKEEVICSNSVDNIPSYCG